MEVQRRGEGSAAAAPPEGGGVTTPKRRGVAQGSKKGPQKSSRSAQTPPSRGSDCSGRSNGPGQDEDGSEDGNEDEDDAAAQTPGGMETAARSKGVPLPARAEGAAPLPEEPPAEAIRTTKDAAVARSNKKAETAPGRNSTAKQYSTTGNKWFSMFCVYAGWDEAEYRVWIHPETGVVRDGIFKNLFLYMHAFPGMTKAPFKTLLNWCTWELNHQATKLNIKLAKAYVRDIPGIFALKKEVYDTQRTSRLELHEDMQAFVACEIGSENMLAMCDDCLQMNIPHAPLFSFQTLYEIRQTHQVSGSPASARATGTALTHPLDAPPPQARH